MSKKAADVPQPEEKGPIFVTSRLRQRRVEMERTLAETPIDKLSKVELENLVEDLGIEVSGTGAKGSVLRSDIVEAIEGSQQPEFIKLSTKP